MAKRFGMERCRFGVVLRRFAGKAVKQVPGDSQMPYSPTPFKRLHVLDGALTPLRISCNTWVCRLSIPGCTSRGRRTRSAVGTCSRVRFDLIS